MGNKKVSQLNTGTTLDGTELVPVVQGGNLVQTTTQEIADLGGGSQSLQDVINLDNHANGEIIKSQSDNSNITLLFDVLTTTISDGLDTTVVEQTPTGLNITSPSITKNSVELATVDDLDFKKDKQVIASATAQTAVNDVDYIVNVSTTFTDPTPVEAKGYTVFVRNGTATIGGIAYSTSGTRIYRYYHSGSWATYTSDIITQTITNGVTDKAPSEDAVYDALALKAPIASPTFTGTVTSPIILVSGTSGNGYIDITNQSSDPSSPSSGVNRVFIDALGKLSKKNSVSTKVTYRAIVYSDLTTSSAVTGTVSNTLVKSGLVKGNTFNTSATDSIRIQSRLLKTGTSGTWTQRLYVNTSNSLSGATLLGTQGGSAANTFLNIQRNGIIKSTTNTEFLETSTNVSGDEAAAASAGPGGITTVNIDHTIDQYYIQAVQNANTGDSSVSSYLKIFRD